MCTKLKADKTNESNKRKRRQNQVSLNFSLKLNEKDYIKYNKFCSGSLQ